MFIGRLNVLFGEVSIQVLCPFFNWIFFGGVLGFISSAVLITMALYSLISDSMIPPTLFFFLKIAVAIWDLLWFHIHFWNICSSFVKYAIGIFTGIMLNL